MKNNKVRLIIDTNLWISFLLSKDFSKLDVLFDNSKIVLLFSEELLDEFTEVARRPKFQKYFRPDILEDMLNAINEYAEFISVISTIALCRDEKDNFLLALACDGKADYLITGDKDLLVLDKVQETKIITMSDFLDSQK